MPETYTVSTSFLRPLLAAVEEAGIAPASALQGTPLTVEHLMVPNSRIGIGIARMIWQRAVKLTRDDLLGLAVAEKMKPSTFHTLGMAFLSSATLAHAVDLTVRYQRLVSEAGMLHTEPLDNGQLALVQAEQNGKPALLAQQTEALIAGMHLQSRSLTQRLIVPVEVHFRHPPQGDAARYVACFGVLPQFNADAHRIIFARDDLQRPLPYADEELCRRHCDWADQQCASLPAIGYVASYAVQWLSSRVGGNVGVADLANALGMSVRNLQRALRDEGTSWRTLVDGARREALSRLLQTGVSLEAAAQQLGYHDASSVSRAGRRWFGEPPKRWSERQ
ncbi:AraC family transcriptional regulator [Massilia pseudoviolaceinigra]|uniref:AraC family transcriptional regulator n=1 Tax=Massilia pseudoviolaceinigra TaxID=3057165 RepID=UPI0027969CF5|nr:AraC family transcriptional regulator [Massilia sp. CCM 9206]MDQ1924832.1 AraC family transcriptional regulator [Massilia sp. CCM 9206]